jgi:hypothetical protein
VQEEALLALREKAMLNSRRPGITGVLIYRKGFFMQYIEGKESAVLDLYRQLRGTELHFNVRVLSHGPLQNRLFDNWSIRWVLDNEPGPSSESLIDLFETVLSSKSISTNEISAVLRRFWKNSQILELQQFPQSQSL